MFKIGLALTIMAAIHAVLREGSAPVGVAFKGAATATDASAGLLRRFKQWGRNKAAASGEGSFLRSVFDASKSTDKKFAMYNGYVDKLYDMVLERNDMPRRPSSHRGGFSSKERLCVCVRNGNEQGRSRFALHNAHGNAEKVDQKDEGA